MEGQGTFEPPGQVQNTKQHEPPGQIKKAENQRPAAPPGQVKHQDPSPAGYGRRAPFEHKGAVTRPNLARPQAAEGEVQPSGVLAPGDGRRFGGSALEAPLVAEAATGRPGDRANKTFVSVAERSDVRRPAEPGVLPHETGTGRGNNHLSSYGVERMGTVLEPLRGAAAAMLGWTEQVTISVIERAAELVESILLQGSYGKHGPPERAPPLPPGSGSSGSTFSGVGEAGGPLLAVLSLLIILARAGRFWPPYELPRPRLIPRQVSERPG